MRMKQTIVILIYFCTLLLILYIMAFLVIYPWQPRQITLFHQPGQADAIVVLEGERYTRVNQALFLAEKGYSHRLIFPDLELPENERAIRTWTEEHPGVLEVFKDTGPTSTYEEAIKTKEYVKKLRLKSLLLVTSSYHSYRAWWIFQKVLPGVKIYSVPVPLGTDWFSPDKIAAGNDYEKFFKAEQRKFAFYYFCYGWRMY